MLAVRVVVRVLDFVEVVLVELADEAGEVAMFEVLRKNGLCEFLVLMWSRVSQQLSIHKSIDGRRGQLYS